MEKLHPAMTQKNHKAFVQLHACSCRRSSLCSCYRAKASVVAQVVSRGPRSFTLFHGLFFWATCFSSEHVILCLCLYLSASPRNPKIGSIRAWPAVVLSSWKQECKERAESQKHHSDTEKTAANSKRGYCVDLTCLTALVCLRC